MPGAGHVGSGFGCAYRVEPFVEGFDVLEAIFESKASISPDFSGLAFRCQTPRSVSISWGGAGWSHIEKSDWLTLKVMEIMSSDRRCKMCRRNGPT